MYAALFVGFLATLLHLYSAQPLVYDHGIDLPTTQPLIIAHRGASGVYPEHTSAAYQLAIDQGADAIECDLCLSKDLHVVCLHESWMNDTTNVADVFSEDRANTYIIGGRPRTDYFSVDFTLDELKTISLNQRYSYRDQGFNYQYPIVSLHELIDMVQAADRTVGLFPEIKNPNWVNGLEIIKEANTTFEALIVETLESRGYVDETSPCVIMSFYVGSILDTAELTSLPVLMLDAAATISDSILEYYSTFAYAIGPEISLIVRTGLDNRITQITDIVERAHNVSLRVFPWTARNEYMHLPFDYEQDPHLEYQTLLSTGVDGIISDFPGTFKRYLQGVYCETCANITTKT